jgi:hypothetical protein
MLPDRLVLVMMTRLQDTRAAQSKRATCKKDK